MFVLEIGAAQNDPYMAKQGPTSKYQYSKVCQPFGNLYSLHPSRRYNAKDLGFSSQIERSIIVLAQLDPSTHAQAYHQAGARP